MRVSCVRNLGVRKNFYNNILLAKSNKMASVNYDSNMSNSGYMPISFYGRKQTNYIKEISEQPNYGFSDTFEIGFCFS